MTLDEAIKHAEEVMVENLEKTKGRNASDPIALNCFKCAEEHRQLAEWLRELKAYKEQTDGDLISRTDLLKELEKWDWQDAYLPIHFKELVENCRVQRKQL